MQKEKEKLILEVELFGKEERVKHDFKRNLVKLVLMDFTKKIYKKLELKGPFILDFELKGLGKLFKRNVFPPFPLTNYDDYPFWDKKF